MARALPITALTAAVTILAALLPTPLSLTRTAAVQFADPYTRVQVHGDLPFSFPTSQQTTQFGSTSHSHTQISNPIHNHGEVTAEGFASFTSLRGRVDPNSGATYSGTDYSPLITTTIPTIPEPALLPVVSLTSAVLIRPRRPRPAPATAH